MIPKLTGIMIDLGGVLVHNDESAVWQVWEERTGIAGEDLRVELYDRGLKEEFDRGLKHPAGIALFLAMRFDIELTLDDWREIWNRGVRVDKEMDEFIRAVAVHIPCVVASTTDRLHFEKLADELTCLEFFKGQAVSYKMGCVKPDPTFYRRALEGTEFEAATTLFIDDREPNVMGAVDAGMHATRFIDIAKLKSDLAGFGLRI